MSRSTLKLPNSKLNLLLSLPRSGLIEWLKDFNEDQKLTILEQMEKRSKVAPRGLTGTLKYSPHKPWPKQQRFLDLECKEGFFGGAAAGGKSDTLLMAGLEYVHLPNYSALILRRDFARLSLPGSIMDRARSWLYNTDAEWNGDRKTFRFPSGAVLQFGYIDSPDDRFRYASSEFQFIGWDELTEFALPESDAHGQAADANPYLFLFSRLRKTADNPIPLRIRSASNPGNQGHAFVKRRFVVPEAEADMKANTPKDIYWNEIGGEQVAFVPSKIRDNPSIDEEEYNQQLIHLPPVTRERLKNGDWSISVAGLIRFEWLRYYQMQGQMLQLLDASDNKIAVFDERDCRRIATIDTAGTSEERVRESKGKTASWSVMGIWDRPPGKFGNKLILRHIWRARVDYTDLLAGVLQTYNDWKPTQVIVENKHFGPALYSQLKGKMSITTIEPGQKDKVTRAAPLLNMLERGEVYLPKYNTGWRQALEAEWLSWQGLDDETNDQVDMSAYAAIHVGGNNGGGPIKIEFPFMG